MTLAEQEGLLTNTCSQCKVQKFKISTTLNTRTFLYAFMFSSFLALFIVYYDQSLIDCLALFSITILPLVLISFLVNHSTVFIFKDSNNNLHFHTTGTVFVDNNCCYYYYHDEKTNKDVKINSIILKGNTFGLFYWINVESSYKLSGIKIHLSRKTGGCFLLKLKTEGRNKPIVCIYDLEQLFEFLQLLETQQIDLSLLVYNYMKKSKTSETLYKSIVSILAQMEIMKDTMGRSRHAQALRKMLEDALNQVRSDIHWKKDKAKALKEMLDATTEEKEEKKVAS